jgi:protein-disulfide isomerase
MKTSRFLERVSIYLLLTGVLFTLLTTSGRALAAEDQQATVTVNEERIVQRLKEEIMKEFRSGDFLQQQIEIGIRNYILEQQQAQEKAQTQQRGRADKLAQNIRPVSAGRDHINGNPDAEISLVEYSDFECPFCKKFHPTAKRLVDAFDGKVNWVYRHFPLSFHNPGAQKQAEASECANELAGNDMFWKYTDAIYARTKSNGRGFPIENLVPLAGELSIDEQKFKTCLDSERYADRVQEDIDEGSSIGITGTPGNVLLNNRTGKTLARAGAQPFTALKVDIEKLLTAE